MPELITGPIATDHDVFRHILTSFQFSVWAAPEPNTGNGEITMSSPLLIVFVCDPLGNELNAFRNCSDQTNLKSLSSQSLQAIKVVQRFTSTRDY